MKAGDLLVSSANTMSSWGIRIGTLSDVSHVAMMVGPDKVIESTPNGTKTVDLATFLKSNRRVHSLERPQPLTPAQVAHLQSLVQTAHRPGYSLVRSLSSGVARFALWFLGACLVGIDAWVMYHGLEFFWLAALFSLVMLLPFGISLVAAHPHRFNALMDKLHMPGWTKTNLDLHFCSQLVLWLDQQITGGLSQGLHLPHEPRPADLKRHARKLRYCYRQLKP